MTKLRQLNVRDDGEEIQIEFGESNDQKTVTVTLSENDALRLYNHLAESVLAARANRSRKSDTPKTFGKLPDVVLANRLELQMMSDGTVNFLIQGQDGRQLQVSFHDKHVEMFRQAFGKTGH